MCKVACGHSGSRFGSLTCPVVGCLTIERIRGCCVVLAAPRCSSCGSSSYLYQLVVLLLVLVLYY